MTDPSGPAVHDAPPAADAAPGRLPVRRSSCLVAVGGVLIVLELPVLAALGRLTGIALVVAGVLALRARTVDPVARARLNVAALLAAVVAVTVVVLSLLALTMTPGTQPPAWAEATAVAQTVLGIVGTVLLAAGMARELAGRGRPDAEDAWWLAALAVVLIHGPILVAALLAHLTGRPGGVYGPAAIALFLVAIVPYLLIARAGRHSDPPTLRTRPQAAPPPPVSHAPTSM
jgi:cytochrome bd-type quinol oxidase subunit 2